MLKSARKNAGLSLEMAAQSAYSDPKTLSRYENGHSFPPPERVLQLAKVYDQPDLPYRYCSHMCPIGRQTQPWATDKELSGVVLALLKTIEHSRSHMDRLVEMACAGDIPVDETRQFKEIFERFLELEQAIVDLKLWTAKQKLYPFPRKERAALTKEDCATYGYSFNEPSAKELNYVWPVPLA